MARLDRLLVGRDRQARGEAILALGHRLAEQVEQGFGIGHLEVPARHLPLVFEEHVAIGHAPPVEIEVVHIVDALEIHRQPFQPVGQFARHRLAVEPAHLLEIGELRHLHPVAPDLPAQPPRAQRRAFPIIFHEADIVLERINPDHAEAVEIELLDIGRARLQDYLILVIMLEPVGIFAVAPVCRPPARLDEGGVPRFGAQRAQGGGGMEGARPHPHIVRLEDQAALRTPEIVQREDHVLKRAGRLARHGAGQCRRGARRSMPRAREHARRQHILTECKACLTLAANRCINVKTT